MRALNRVLRIDGSGVRYEADPRHAEVLAAMLAPSARAFTSPGLRESAGPLVEEELPEAQEEEKVFSLDESWGGLGASWSQEEEEEQCEEEPSEEATRPAGRVCPGRRERAAARGEEEAVPIKREVVVKPEKRDEEPEQKIMKVEFIVDNARALRTRM